MTYHIDHYLAGSTLRVTLSGDLSHEELYRLKQEVGELARRAATLRLLVDVRRLHHSIGPVETLQLIETYAAERPTWRTAVLETPEQMPQHQFHETAANNRGFQILHFTDEASALGWLHVRSDGK